jgi:GH25 family lysozyme M1 (1,4-beta-N-acetylmuramidase)
MLSWLRGLLRTAPRRKLAGVDVSVYQGPPGTWKDVAGRFDWAAVKITELEPDGTRYVNPYAGDDWNWLKRNDKYRIAYLFGHPSVSARDSVDFFVTELRKLGLGRTDGVALDLEVTDGLTPQRVSSWAEQVMDDLSQRLTRPPVLYTFLSFAEGGNCAGLGHFPLWIADPSSPAGHPRVPRPWKKWTIHQYVITGPIDRDVANFPSRAEMAAALGEPEEPNLKNLGGSIAAAVNSVRWNSGVIVVAGLGEDGYIHTTRYSDGKWAPWKSVSSGKARGAPALLAWGPAEGHLYYTDDAGHVVELETGNAGETWA